VFSYYSPHGAIILFTTYYLKNIGSPTNYVGMFGSRVQLNFFDDLYVPHANTQNCKQISKLFFCESEYSYCSRLPVAIQISNVKNVNDSCSCVCKTFFNLVSMMEIENKTSWLKSNKFFFIIQLNVMSKTI